MSCEGKIPTKVFITDRFILSICWGDGAPHIAFFVVVIGANYFLSVVTKSSKKDSPLKRLSGGCRPLRGGMPEG